MKSDGAKMFGFYLRCAPPNLVLSGYVKVVKRKYCKIQSGMMIHEKKKITNYTIQWVGLPKVSNYMKSRKNIKNSSKHSSESKQYKNRENFNQKHSQRCEARACNLSPKVKKKKPKKKIL